MKEFYVQQDGWQSRDIMVHIVFKLRKQYMVRFLFQAISLKFKLLHSYMDVPLIRKVLQPWRSVSHVQNVEPKFHVHDVMIEMLIWL